MSNLTAGVNAHTTAMLCYGPRSTVHPYDNDDDNFSKIDVFKCFFLYLRFFHEYNKAVQEDALKDSQKAAESPSAVENKKSD